VLPEGGRGEGIDGVSLSPVPALDRLVAEIAARSPRGLRTATSREET